jgi:NTP pyrophosphatase (non-canonical NTP hydrolase)
MNIYELHEKITKDLFPSYSNTDERFLTIALCGEVGELANMIKKQWRDDINLEYEIREELCDIRIYLELLAKCYNIEGEKLDKAVEEKLIKVARKRGIK